MNDLIQKIKQKFPNKFENLYLDNIVLYKVKSYVNIYLQSKDIYADEDKRLLEEFIKEIFPENIKINAIEYSKIFCDTEIAVNEIKKIIKNEYPSLHASIADIACDEKENSFIFDITCNDIIQSYISSSKAQFLIVNALKEKYKIDFSINFTYIETMVSTNEDYPVNLVVSESAVSNQDAAKRIIEVDNITPIIGSLDDGQASYIEDRNMGPYPIATLCGKIKFLTEKVTKTERILFNFKLEDFTGKISCIIFPSAANLEKARQLKENMEVLASGSIEFDEYRNGYTFKIKQISTCQLPIDFVKINKTSLPVPERYSLIFPQKIEIASQVDFFGGGVKEVSKYFFNKTFVVFDIETTGLNYDLDKITEIGAIKIEDGIITQSFSTLINPKVHIREETVKLNGIDDEMVKDMPTIEEVLPDFYKFCYGTELVAHNIDFDFNFIRYNSEKIGYYFYNENFDTLGIARERVKGLSNYKLDTLCAYFNIELTEHHRAWHDALATAKLYIELMNVKVPLV